MNLPKIMTVFLLRKELFKLHNTDSYESPPLALERGGAGKLCKPVLLISGRRCQGRKKKNDIYCLIILRSGIHMNFILFEIHNWKQGPDCKHQQRLPRKWHFKNCS